MSFDPKKLEAFLKAKQQQAGAARTGGKGTVRRKHKAVRKTQTHDEKKLKSTLQKLNVRDIPAIEEVNLFQADGTVIHFAAPKVQASIAANTYVITGSAETKKLQDLLPGIINQLGPDNLEELKKIYASFQAGELGGAKPEEDDDDVPELVENFEDVSKAKPAEKEAQKPAKEKPKSAPKLEEEEEEEEEEAPKPKKVEKEKPKSAPKQEEEAPKPKKVEKEKPKSPPKQEKEDEEEEAPKPKKESKKKVSDKPKKKGSQEEEG